MTLEKKRYRLAFLNGCGSRYINMFFEDAGVRLPFELIRTEQDFLRNPVRVTQLLISPGARMEIIIDLTNAVGNVVMKNDAATPFPFGDPVDAFTSNVMQFVTVAPASPVVNPREGLLANVDAEGVLTSVSIKQGTFPAFPEQYRDFVTMIEVPDDQGAG